MTCLTDKVSFQHLFLNVRNTHTQSCLWLYGWPLSSIWAPCSFGSNLPCTFVLVSFFLVQALLSVGSAFFLIPTASSQRHWSIYQNNSCPSFSLKAMHSFLLQTKWSPLVMIMSLFLVTHHLCGHLINVCLWDWRLFCLFIIFTTWTNSWHIVDGCFLLIGRMYGWMNESLFVLHIAARGFLLLD